jgi:uroporphyrinogen decarboxylase
MAEVRMASPGISAKERVIRALRGQADFSPPTGPLAVHYSARLAGVSLREYTTSAKALADCVLQFYDRFRPDAVWLSADTWVTAQAMGAAVAFPDGDQPLGGTGQPLIRSAADLERIPTPDVAGQGRWPLMLQALADVRQGLGPDVFLVACFDQYPFSLACALMGLEQAMVSMREDRALLEGVLEKACACAIAYGKAMAAAGADMLSGGDSPAGLLGPRDYREIALPWEQRVIAELKKAVKAPVSLHICGKAAPILADMARSGADVLELDHQVPLPGAFQIVAPDIAIWGNLDPVGVLAQGNPQSVREATVDLLRSVAASGFRRFILSSGCTLAVETPTGNLDAFFEAARGEPSGKMSLPRAGKRNVASGRPGQP